MRVKNWDLRLLEVIEAARSKSFQYGIFDCALFSADCVLAQTGIDIAAEFRGYESKIAALRIIAEHGSLSNLISYATKTQPQHISKARRGDLVSAKFEGGEDADAECIGVCFGVQCFFVATQGVWTKPTAACLQCWRIE